MNFLQSIMGHEIPKCICEMNAVSVQYIASLLRLLHQKFLQNSVILLDLSALNNRTVLLLERSASLLMQYSLSRHLLRSLFQDRLKSFEESRPTQLIEDRVCLSILLNTFDLILLKYIFVMGGEPSKNVQTEQINDTTVVQTYQSVPQPSVLPPKQLPKSPQHTSPQPARPTQTLTNPSPNRNYLQSTIQEANQAVYSRAVKTKKKVKSNRRIVDAIQTEELKDARVNYSVNYQRKKESISQHNQSTKIEIEDLD